MSVSTTQYVRKPLYVDAVRITNSNFEEIAEWCQGEIKYDEVSVGTGIGKKYIKIRVHNPKNQRQTRAFVGDWLLYTERGYKVYTNKAFHSSFDERAVVEVTEEPRSYPHDDGGMTIIGPECFAQSDGTVLSWKGRNYIPQPEPGINVEEAIKTAREDQNHKEPTAERVA